MPSRLRFNRTQITKAFRWGWKAKKPMSKVTIDPDLLDRISQQDQNAVEELLDEIDALIASAMTGQIKTAVVSNIAPVDNKSNVVDGMNCDKCKNYIQYASANQPNNTFICYSCRS